MTLDIAKLRAETLALIDCTTPGPWGAYGQSVKANGWCDTFDGAVLVNIARADDAEQADYEGRVWGVAGRPEANTRLIAAAPTLASDTLRLLDEIERLRDVLQDIVESWDWWTVDEYDRDRGGLADSIDAARAALSEGDPA